MPASAEKLTGPHCVPSLNTFCLVVQQMPEHFNGADPPDSTHPLPALLPLSLAIRRVSARLLSTSLVTSSSSTAPCTLTVMTRNFLRSLNRCGDYSKVGFSPTPEYSTCQEINAFKPRGGNSDPASSPALLLAVLYRSYSWL